MIWKSHTVTHLHTLRQERWHLICSHSPLCSGWLVGTYFLIQSRAGLTSQSPRPFSLHQIANANKSDDTNVHLNNHQCDQNRPVARNLASSCELWVFCLVQLLIQRGRGLGATLLAATRGRSTCCDLMQRDVIWANCPTVVTSRAQMFPNISRSSSMRHSWTPSFRSVQNLFSAHDKSQFEHF